MPPFDLALPAKSPSRVSRSLSISSDRTSQSGFGGLYSPPLNVTPEAGFIAASAASQIVTNDHDSRADSWLDQHGIEPSGETALVAPSALMLLNRFLDQLLFSFLAVSKSTSLVSLRPAVSEVLKTKLAQHAIHGADQELHEYLGGGEDEEILTFHNAADTRDNWDLELVWKRTRLRCMVYSSLGDMEEEDEDYYTEQEQLDGAGSSRFAPGVVSPAVAIFLTSILEYMGEQILVVAGQSAYNRLRTKLEKEEKEGTNTHGDIADRVVVEDFDMERVAMDRTLGRLWRGWKKRVRSPTASVSLPRSFSRDSLQTPISASGYTDIIEERRPSLAAVLAEFEHAALIPIPASADDIREIEIPGLADQSDDEDDGAETDDEDFAPSTRPKSLIFFDNVESGVSGTSESLSPTFLTAISRIRSRSLPSPTRTRYNSKHETITPDTEVEDSSTDNLEPEIEIPKDQESNVEEEPEVVHNHIQKEIEHTVVAPATENEVDEKPEINSHGLAGIVAGAVAVGSIAVVGIVAAVKGEAPQTDLVDDDIDVEELNEEAQIMTSSRVSIGGLSPDDVSSKSNSVRSQSVHSLRLIDVASPSRSRTGSIDATDTPGGRPSLSRSNSVHSPLEQIIRGSSPISRVSNSSPLARNASALSTRQVRNGAEDSISEEKEAVYEPVVTPDASDIAGAMQGVDVEPSQVVQPQVEKFQPQKPLSFVLSTPSLRNTRGLSSHTAEESNGTRTSLASSRSMSSERAPSLKPLKETMEGEYSTSDETNSISPSKYSKTISEHGAYAHSPSASGSAISQNQRDQSRNHRHQPITRSSPPRSSPDESRNFSKIQRSHTSDSSSSGHSQKLKALRTSEESAPPKSEDKGKSFEQLIRSDQTIQYTLTPQNMRNIESPDSARHAMTPTIVTNGFDSRRPQTSRSHSSSLSKTVQPTQIEPQSPRSNKLSKTVSRASSNATRSRMNVPQARDARVKRESVQDFAEFIRNTGPTNESKGPPRQPQHRGTNGTPRNVSTSIQRPQTNTTLPRRAESSAGRSRLQARDPVVPRGDSISDLIDFVRSGPQLDGESHRIPRTVAPFRSTMDSDQMVGAVGGKAVDASFPDRYSQAPSVNSSVNSQSALLNGPKKPIQHQPSFDEEPVMPKRKTRRVRDPYAIDVSDEEEEYEAISKPKPIKEESLADFLKNVPPPAVSTVTPIFEPEQARNVKKKSSSTSFRSRFSRKDAPPPMPKSNGNDSRTSTSRSDAPRAPQHTPIAAQYSTTTAPTVYEPTRNNYVAQVDSARNRVAQKSYQPRDAAYSARTNDLADFLKSEPPSSSQTQPKPFTPSAQKEEGAFHRMFGRKKIH